MSLIRKLLIRADDSTIAGVVDIIVLCAKPIGGSTNTDVEGSITWHELP